MNAIDIIELLITDNNDVETRLCATLEHHAENKFLLRIRSPGRIQDRSVELRSEDQTFGRHLAVRELQALIDEFGKPPAVIKVIADTGGFLPTVSYRCSNPKCRAKMFEAWVAGSRRAYNLQKMQNALYADLGRLSTHHARYRSELFEPRRTVKQHLAVKC